MRCVVKSSLFPYWSKPMKLFRVTDIQWDFDASEEDLAESGAPVELPSETFVHAPDSDAVADVLSDRYGWCVKGLVVTETEQSLVLFAA